MLFKNTLILTTITNIFIIIILSLFFSFKKIFFNIVLKSSKLINSLKFQTFKKIFILNNIIFDIL